MASLFKRGRYLYLAFYDIVGKQHQRGLQIEREATIEDVSLLMGEVESLSPVVGHVRSCLSEFHQTAWDVNRQAMGLR